MVAADSLGYAGTSKPTDPHAYSMDKMVADQIEILDEEGIQKCVSVGHDWGSALAQRVYLFRPDRVEAMCLMNVAYRPPSEKPVNLEEMRVTFESTIGYFPFWYWYLFTSPKGAKVLEDHLDSLFDACSGGGKGLRELFCSKDRLRDFLLEDQRAETAEYATEERKRAFVERFKRDGMVSLSHMVSVCRGCFATSLAYGWRSLQPIPVQVLTKPQEGPLCWYKAQLRNVNFEAEKQIPKDKYVVRVPLLFVGGSDDPVCLTAGIHAVQKQGLVPELTVRELDAAHWIMLERPTELGNTVLKWLDQIYGGELES